MGKRLLAGLMAGALMLGGAAFAEKHFTVNVPTSKIAQGGIDALVSPDQNDDVENGDISFSAAVEGNPVSAGIDLSGMSYDELVALHSGVISAMAESDGAISFRAEAGEYVVGQDIPAGAYSVKQAPDAGFAVLIVQGADGRKRVHEYFDPKEHAGKVIGRISLEDGEYLVLENYAFVFAPPAGITFN